VAAEVVARVVEVGHLAVVPARAEAPVGAAVRAVPAAHPLAHAVVRAVAEPRISWTSPVWFTAN
jgi:hypothetical protein